MSKKETNQTKKEVKTYTKKEVFVAILPWAIIYTLVLSVSLTIGMWFYTCNSIGAYNHNVQDAALTIVKSLK